MDPRSVLPLDEALKTGNVCNDVNKMRHSRDLSIIANLPAFPAESYFIRDVLGKGSCGTVFSAHLDNAHQKVALKMIRKATEGKKNQIQETHIENEILLLSIMNSPYIVQYFGAYQTENDIIIVTELLEYGDLWSAIYESPLSLGGMPSDLIRFYAASLVLALSHIHSKGVAYRDLKPENVMLDRKGYIRIIDFGFAKSIPYRVMDRETGQLKLCSKSYTVCGTPEYLPPEVILRSGHDSTVDLWALGVLIFEMVMGRTPFKNSDNDIDAILLQNIVSTKVMQKICGLKSFNLSNLCFARL